MSFIFIGLLLIGGWLAATELVETERKDLISPKHELAETRNLDAIFHVFNLKLCGNLKIISINGRLMEKQNEGRMI